MPNSIEQLLNGETPYATWRSDCPPALLMARAGDADAQGNPTYQMTLQLTVSGLTDGGPRDGSAITFALDRISGEELLHFGEAFDQELRQALEHQLARHHPGQCSAGVVRPGGECLQQPRQRGGL